MCIDRTTTRTAHVRSRAIPVDPHSQTSHLLSTFLSLGTPFPHPPTLSPPPAFPFYHQGHVFVFFVFFQRKLLPKRQKGKPRMQGALAALLVATTAMCAADVSVSMASATLGPTGARGRDFSPAAEEKVPHFQDELRPQYILSILSRLPWAY